MKIIFLIVLLLCFTLLFGIWCYCWLSHKVTILDKEYTDDMYYIIYHTTEILSFYEIKYWAVGSTLLGLVRDGGQIAWNTHASIVIIEEKKFIHMYRDFHSVNLEINHKSEGVYKISLFGKEEPCLEIYIGKQDDEKIVPVSRDINFSFQISDLYPLKLLKFGPILLYSPNNPEPYLIEKYKDWKSHVYRKKEYKNFFHRLAMNPMRKVESDKKIVVPSSDFSKIRI